MALLCTSLMKLFETNRTEGLVYRDEMKNNFISYIINIDHTYIDNICELVIDCQTKLLIKNVEKTNNYDINQGFLIYQWSIDKLKEILSDSSSFLICVIDIEKNKLAGYLLLIPIQHFNQYINSEAGQFELDKKVITDEQWKQYIESPDILYIEQTGVDPEYQRSGIGGYLIRLAQKQGNKGLCTAVIFWPYYNTASINLKTKNGFQPIGMWNQMICSEFVPFKSTIYIWPSIQST